MLSEPVIATALIGATWLLFYRLRRGAFPASLGQVDLRSPGLFILAFGINLLLAVLGLLKVGFIPAVFPYLYIFSYLVLLIAVFRNWQMLGMKIAALGVALNLLVIIANGGHMPADLRLAERTGKVYLLQSQDYPRSRPITPQTRLPFLGDVFALTKPYPLPQIFSLGDIVLTAGACWLVLCLMGLLPQRPPKPRQSAAVENLPEGSE